MRFEIRGCEEKDLKEFVDLAKAEFEKQESKLKKWGINFIFDIRYWKEGDKHILFTSLPSFQDSFWLRIVFKRVAKRMEKNLRKYFEAKGKKVEVKFIGD